MASSPKWEHKVPTCACVWKKTTPEDHEGVRLQDMAAFYMALRRRQILKSSQKGRNKIAPVEQNFQLLPWKSLAAFVN